MKILKIILVILFLAVIIASCLILFNGSEENYNIEFYIDGEKVFTYTTFGNDKIDFEKVFTDEQVDGWYFDEGIWKNQFNNLDSIKNFTVERSATIKVYAKITGRS